MKKDKISTQEVADALGISVQTVRIGLQRGRLPIGWAIQGTGKKYTYAISKKLFEEYLGSRRVV